MKKIICFILAVLCMFTAVGCAPAGGGGGENYAARPKKITIIYYSAGWGKDWIDNNAKWYMDNVDKDLFVDVRHTILSGEEGEKVNQDLSDGDIILVSHIFFRQWAHLTDLTDIVYNQKVYGEDKTFYEKCDPSIKEWYREKGKFYQFGWGGVGGYNYAYNKTTLDDAFGKDNYQLPRTTDEFFEFGDILKTKNIYLTAEAFYDSTSYFNYGLITYAGQMLGYENRENLVNGHWDNDGDGTYEFQQTPDYLRDPLVQNAVEACWRFIQKLGKKSNGYIHADSASMNFQQAQATVCGLGFGHNQRKVAFSYNGGWVEEEMRYLMDEYEAETGTKQELRAMRIPIMSEIISRTPSITNDTQLREVISYVDGDITERPSFVTDTDLAIIDEARHMVGNNRMGGGVIPKTSKNVEDAANFVLYMASDTAQEIAMKGTRGIPILPYGLYDLPTATPFCKDVVAINEDILYIDWANLEKPFWAGAGGVNLHHTDMTGLPLANIFGGQLNNTPEYYYDFMYNYHATQWNQKVATYNRVIDEGMYDKNA